jgi:hypothetical protein
MEINSVKAANHKKGPMNPRPPTTVNLQATSDNKRRVNVLCGRAGARSRAHVRGRAFTGARFRARVRGRALSPQPLYNLHSWVGSIVTRFHYWKV